MIRVEQIPIGQWKTNCYIASDSAKDAVIIDPGNDSDRISQYIKQNELNPRAIINTHSHHDHIGAVCDLKEEFGIPFYLHEEESSILRRAKLYSMVFEGHANIRIPSVDFDMPADEPLAFAEIKIRTMFTPGHTPGGTSFLIDNYLFTGDTLLYKTLTWKELPGADKDKLRESVHKLFELSEDLMLCPGHGRMARYDQGMREKIESFL